jgi:hypothetical protein
MACPRCHPAAFKCPLCGSQDFEYREVDTRTTTLDAEADAHGRIFTDVRGEGSTKWDGGHAFFFCLVCHAELVAYHKGNYAWPVGQSTPDTEPVG